MPIRMTVSQPMTGEDERVCPVPDAMLGELYRAPTHRIAELVEDLPADKRARLALFCYGKAHLHRIGFAIAATCELSALVREAGLAGSILYAQARERPAEPAVSLGRGKVTLASFA